MERGYIKLWRGITDSELYFTEKFTKSAAWVDLLLLANFQQRSVEVRGILVELKPGQVLASEKFLAERWQWSREKVRNYLSLISSKTRQQIIWKKSNVCSVVEIVNWPLYQQDRTADRTTEKHQTGQQKNTPKNVENVKKGKKKSLYTDDFEKFWLVYPRKNGKGKAFESWDSIGDLPPVDAVIQSVETHIRSEQWRRDRGQYIPMPATWLNQRRWEDEPEIKADLFKKSAGYRI